MSGFILVNKPSGISSFQAIKRLFSKFHHHNLGHTGTLDPLASGLLVVACGKKALKTIRFVNSEDKEYIATIKLGIQTNTGDIEGKKIKQKKIVKIFNVQNILNSFLGHQKQVPPIYSAKKINGKRAYSFARKGLKFTLKPQEIEIKKIKLIAYVGAEITFKVLVSKGTYIRVLCEDIAKKTNNFGTMKSLIRTKVGKFRLSQASPIQEVSRKHLIPILDVINLKKINITQKDYQKIFYGQKIFLKEKGTIALIFNKQLVSIVENNENFKIVRNFSENS